MTQIQASSELFNILTKTVIHQAQRVKELWDCIAVSSENKNDYSSFVQAVNFYTKTAGQYENTAHLKLAEKLQDLCAQKQDKQQHQAISDIIKQLEIMGLRETDTQDSDKQEEKKIQFFFVGKKESNHQRLLQKLAQFNIHCTWLAMEDIEKSMVAKRSLLLFDSQLLTDKNVIPCLQKRHQNQQVSLALYANKLPSADIRANALSYQAELLDSEDFPSLIKVIHEKSHVRAIADIRLFLLLGEPPESSHIQQYIEQSEFKISRFSQVNHLLEHLNTQAADAIVVTPKAAQEIAYSLAELVKQQSTQAHVPIVYIEKQDGQTKSKQQTAIMNIRVQDECDGQLFVQNLLKLIAQSVRLKQLISQDRLTGLYTHSYFLDELKHRLNETTSGEMSLVMLDIDCFKEVNDSYGHQVGDYVLQNLALYLKQNLRYNDPIGRYGGEEFAILLDVDENQALTIMDKIRIGFGEFEQESSNQFSVSFSCGIAPWHGQSVKELVSETDQSLYQAKQAGRNCCVIYRDINKKMIN